MLLITAETTEVTTCLHCPASLSEDNEARDSNGDRVCEDCYHDGTAYVEPLDLARDHGGGW
jgi:hypothetical protein